MQNTMWHNTIWAPCEKWDYLGGDCQLCVTVITFFHEQRRDSLTTWPAVIIYSLWHYLCLSGTVFVFLQVKWNEFGNGINTRRHDEKMSNPPANWNKKYIPPAVNLPLCSCCSFFYSLSKRKKTLRFGCFRESGRSSPGRHAVGFILQPDHLHGGLNDVGCLFQGSV